MFERVFDRGQGITKPLSAQPPAHDAIGSVEGIWMLG
jgi:hypothetical protein